MRYETSKHQPRIINIMMTILVLIGLVCIAIAVFVEESPGSRIGLGLFSLFWFFLAGIMYLSSYAKYTHYETRPEGLYCRGVYKKGLLPYEEIESCRVLSADEFNQVINNRASNIAHGEADMDIYTWWKSSKKYGELTRFATVQSAHTTVTKGSFRNISSVSSHTRGEALLVSMKSGAEYLLTPIEPEKLAEDISGLQTGNPLG